MTIGLIQDGDSHITPSFPIASISLGLQEEFCWKVKKARKSLTVLQTRAVTLVFSAMYHMYTEFIESQGSTDMVSLSLGVSFFPSTDLLWRV